ncbi:MAG TPA: CHRD domain-containing protein [Noviherbaspirillum sp.]|nr:CHRD domain-containing protein [Noviherbaspirillum sp.]
MHTARTIGAVVAAVAAGLSSTYTHAQEFTTQLSGFNEVPAAILSPGTGVLHLNLDAQAGTLSYTLSYSDLTTPVTQAHIHFGKEHVAGGVMVFFCSNMGNAPAGTPPCPESGGTVNGAITADGVVGPEQQNVTPRDFNALVAAITSQTGYANVHTTKFPPGEIRGEIRMTDQDGG